MFGRAFTPDAGRAELYATIGEASPDALVDLILVDIPPACFDEAMSQLVESLVMQHCTVLVDASAPQ